MTGSSSSLSFNYLKLMHALITEILNTFRKKEAGFAKSQNQSNSILKSKRDPGYSFSAGEI